MLLKFKANEIKNKKESIVELFSDIDYWLPHNSETFFSKFIIYNNTIKKYLIKHANLEFNIEVCNLTFLGYEYVFDMWLNESPFFYESIINKEDFYWNLIEQNYEVTFSFKYVKDNYILTVDCLEDYGIEASLSETIKTDDLKKVIEDVLLQYYQYIKNNLIEIPPEYVKMLDFSFDKPSYLVD